MTTISALLSLPIILALAVIAVLAVIERWQFRGAGPLLVLQKFEVTENGDPLIVIKGRQSGVMFWLLSAVGLTAETSFTVTSSDVFKEGTSLFGFRAQYAPMFNVSSSDCSYFRSILLLALSFAVYGFGFVYFIGAIERSAGADYGRLAAYNSIWPVLFVSAVLGSVLYFAYALSKRIMISVQTEGDKKIRVSFKRSVIENVAADLSTAVRAVNVLNRHLLLTRHPR